MPTSPAEPPHRRGPSYLTARRATATVAVAVAALGIAAGCSPSTGTAEGTTATTAVVGTTGPPVTTTPEVAFSADDVPTIKVTTTEEGERFRFDAPDVATAGPLEIDVENVGQLPHDLVLLRANPPTTTTQLAELLTGPAPEASAKTAQFLGGTALLEPKGKQSVAVRVEPGEYFLASFSRGADGRPGTTRGMVKKLTVVPPSDRDARRTKPQFDNAGVSITDATIKLPDGFGLPGWYKVTNEGTQPHDLTIIRLKDGVRPEDAKSWLLAVESGPPPTAAPFTHVGGSSALDAKASDSIRVEDLGKGSFVVYSSLPDRGAGFAPQFDKGLFVPFTRA